MSEAPMPSSAILEYANHNEDLQLLSVKEVAELLRVDKSTVYRLIQQSDLRSVRWGRSVRVRRMDLKSFQDAHIGY